MQSEVGTLLETIIGEVVPAGEPVALLLSGGVDSLSVGFAATKLGLPVHAYTFQVGHWANPDSVSAERAAYKMGWGFTLVRVPVDKLEDDFLRLAYDWKCAKKTQFECSWPFLYVVPEIVERFVLSGIAADGHFGLSKKAMIHFREPKDRFDSFRYTYFASPNPAGQVQQKAMIEAAGKTQVAPYLDSRMFDYFIGLDWATINKPHQKMPTLYAYPEWFNLVGRRDHKNLQLVSGVDTIFKGLLTSKLNTKARTRVMDLCRDYAQIETGKDYDYDE